MHDELPAVYLLAAPVGGFVSDFSVSALRILKATRTVFVEDLASSAALQQVLGRMHALDENHRFVPLTGDESEACAAADALIARGESFVVLANEGIASFMDPGLTLLQHLTTRHAGAVRLEPVGASTALDATLLVNAVDCGRFAFAGHFPENHDFKALKLLDWPCLFYVRSDSVSAFFAGLATALAEVPWDHQVVLTANLRFGPGLQRRVVLAVGDNPEPVAAFLRDLPTSAPDEQGGGPHRHRFTATVVRTRTRPQRQ